MSASYIFTINIVKKGIKNLFSTEIVESLVKAGWSLFSEENLIIYTDVGDSDDFNFLSKAMNKIEYYEIIHRKQKNKEVISFAMFWLENGRNYRIDVMITPDFELSISPEDKTKKMLCSNPDFLDVNWYFGKIIPNLTNEKMSVESFSYLQIG